MSGVTPLVDTLLPTTLAQRTDLIPLKPAVTIGGPEPVPDSEKNANDPRLPSRAAIDRKLGAELVDERGANGTNRRLPGDGTPTLSSTARAISAILRSQGDADIAAVRGSAPLWRLPVAPAAHLLAPMLVRTVAGSGLFYESHLSRYASGKFTLEQLAQEPQARLGPLAKSNPELIEGRAVAQNNLLDALMFAAIKPTPSLNVQSAQSIPQPASAAGANQPNADQSNLNQGNLNQGSLNQGNLNQGNLNQGNLNQGSLNQGSLIEANLNQVNLDQPGPDQAGMNRSTASKSVPDQSAPAPVVVAAAGARPTPASVAAAYHTTSLGAGLAPSENGTGTTNTLSPSTEAVRGSGGHATAAAIHPEAVALVRQQLELLAVPVFRWSGEAWAGVKMDWEIHEQREESQDTPQTTPRVWNTRLNVTLPTLGTVEMRISLADNVLQAHMAANQDASVALLRDDSKALRERLAVAGLKLTALQVVPLPAQPSTQNVVTGDALSGADIASSQPEY